MAVYVVMTLGTFLVVLQMRDADGQPVETIASLSGLSRTPARGSPRRWRSSCSASPASRRCSASGRSSWCSTRRSQAGPDLARGGRHRDLGDRRLLLSQDRQDDVFRRAGAGVRAQPRAGSKAVLIAAAALFVSPLGYLAIPAARRGDACGRTGAVLTLV